MLNFIEKIGKIKLPFLSRFQVYFDLGTSEIRIAIKEKGVVLREPTVIGQNLRTGEFIFFGREAKAIIGKVPDFIKILKPIVNGIISEFDAQVALTQRLLTKALNPYNGSSILKPGIEAVVAVPYVATEIEQKAVEEILYKAGASSVHLIEKPLATAIGCGFNIFAHKPILVVDMGGGLVEMAIVSGGGIVSQKTLKTGGEQMNKLIYNYIYLKHGLILGEMTCEELKLGLLNFQQTDKAMIVRGKSLETGLPKSVKVKTQDIQEALLAPINQIVDGIKELIEMSLPEVIDEVYTQGIILTGGLAGIPGIDKYFNSELKMKIELSPNIDSSTIFGLMKVGRRKETLHRLALHLP